MTTMLEVALAFARECLGWKDARAVHTQDPLGHPRFVVCSPSAERNTLFTPTDLADVRAIARTWCDANDLTLTLEPEADGGPTEASVSRAGRPAEDGRLSRANSPSPGHALLAACVLAHRALAAGP